MILQNSNWCCTARLTAFVVCALIWCWGNESWAGCGSYLLPPVTMAEHEQLPQELRAGKLYGRHNESPCRGPRCQSRPQHDLPVPSAPQLSLTIHDFAAWIGNVVMSLNPARIVSTLAARDDDIANLHGARLERPPRA